MEHVPLHFRDGFRVVAGNARAQAATMVLGPGESTGGPDNRHRGSDQWLYVLSGEGEAVVAGQSVPLSAGDLLRIDAGEAHEIRCTGTQPLQTLNLYVPPAYTGSGEPLPRGED